MPRSAYWRVANPPEVADTGDVVADTGDVVTDTACPSQLLPRRCLRGMSGTRADGPNTFQTKGRVVDGGLACLDADRRGRRSRDDTGTERVSDHGGALGPRLLHAVPVDPPERRVGGGEEHAPAQPARR